MNKRIQEEIYKCSKCGLCQSVCPIYLATKNEMFLARGRNIVLNNFFNNNKRLSRKFIKNLDICLNCNECKNFCPSNIDSSKIYTILKNKYKYSSGILPFSIKLPLKFLSIPKEKQSIKRSKKKNLNVKEKVMYFQGCVNKYGITSDKNATLNILADIGYEVTKISSDCCGLPSLGEGRISDFQNNAGKIFKSIPTDVKYVVCSCDSCYNTLKNIENISYRLVRLEDLLKINNYKIKEKENVVYHKPLTRNDSCLLQTEIKAINRKGSCSIMENFIMMKHPQIAEQLLKSVFYSKEELDNKTIITTCQLDNIGLKKGIKERNSNAKLYTLSEYIYLSDKDFQEN